jgi:hypothetical protein
MKIGSVKVAVDGGMFAGTGAKSYKLTRRLKRPALTGAGQCITH